MDAFFTHLMDKLDETVSKYFTISSEKIEKNKDYYEIFDSLKEYSTEKSDITVEYDALNYLLLKSLNAGENNGSNKDLTYYMITADQGFISWEKQQKYIFHSAPLLALPNQWHAILIRVAGRAIDDIKAFIQFLRMPISDNRMDAEKRKNFVEMVETIKNNPDKNLDEKGRALRWYGRSWKTTLQNGESFNVEEIFKKANEEVDKLLAKNNEYEKRLVESEQRKQETEKKSTENEKRIEEELRNIKKEKQVALNENEQLKVEREHRYKKTASKYYKCGSKNEEEKRNCKVHYFYWNCSFMWLRAFSLF